MSTELPRARRRLAARVLVILDAFSIERPELTLSEISRRTALPIATVYRLLGDLVSWGALVRRADGAYEIGPRLLQVAALAPWNLTLREAAMPHLVDLYDATLATVQLSVLDGFEVVLIEAIPGRGHPVPDHVGARLPAHLVAPGLVLLAYAPAEVQERVFSRPSLADSRAENAHPEDLRKYLAEVRRTSVAFSDGRVPGDTSLAAPIRDPSGCVTGAVSIVTTRSRAETRLLAPRLRAAASAISRTLWGITPNPGSAGAGIVCANGYGSAGSVASS